MQDQEQVLGFEKKLANFKVEEQYIFRIKLTLAVLRNNEKQTF